MTGRELILYILENGLEDEPVFSNDRFVGFITAGEAAAKMNVGIATILVWLNRGELDGIRIRDRIYIPANATRPENHEMIID